MRYSILSASVAALIMVSAAPTLAENFKRIKKAEDFNALIVGKTIVWDGGSGVVHADGTTKGKLDKSGKYYGNWVWNGGYYCRNLIIKGKETGTNCQKIEVDGANARFTRDKGKGRETLAVLK